MTDKPKDLQQFEVQINHVNQYNILLSYST